MSIKSGQLHYSYRQPDQADDSEELQHYLSVTTPHRVLVGACFLASTACDQLPPRTAVKAARVLIGLSVPYFSTVEQFDDQQMLADATVVIRIKPDSGAFEALLKEAPTKGYKRLPAPKGLDRVGLGGYANPSASGWFFFEEYPKGGGFRVAVLDSRTRRLNVQSAIY